MADRIVDTYIQLVLLRESTGVARRDISAQQIVVACAVGVHTFAELAAGGLIFSGGEIRMLSREEIVGRVARRRHTQFRAEAQTFKNLPLHGEVIDEGEILTLVYRVQRSVVEGVADERGAVGIVVESLYEVAVGIVGIVVRLHVDIILEGAVFALFGVVARHTRIVAEDEVVDAVHQRDVTVDILTVAAFHGSLHVVVS